MPSAAPGVTLRSVAVFCGSAAGNHPDYAAAATAMGAALAARNIRLVYGGGQVGLMGTVADAVLASGGTVTGVIPTALFDRELGHTGVTDLRVVTTMHERKLVMSSEADAFIALPGGPGTLEEITEQWTWAQLGYHNKPCALVNVNGYFDALVDQISHMVDEGFVSEAHANMVIVEEDAERALTAIEHYRAPASKWAGRSIVMR